MLMNNKYQYYKYYGNLIGILCNKVMLISPQPGTLSVYTMISMLQMGLNFEPVDIVKYEPISTFKCTLIGYSQLPAVIFFSITHYLDDQNNLQT